jgi:hypothetical protein
VAPQGSVVAPSTAVSSAQLIVQTEVTAQSVQMPRARDDKKEKLKALKEQLARVQQSLQQSF